MGNKSVIKWTGVYNVLDNQMISGEVLLNWSGVVYVDFDLYINFICYYEY